MGGYSNFHSHCTYCDGHSHPEDFLKSAIARDFRAYGFSSHSPIPFETSWNMPKDLMMSYITEINRLKKKYNGQVEIYLGLEIDFLDRTYNASKDYFRNLPLDYRIGSVHFVKGLEPLSANNLLCIDGRYRDFEDGVKQLFDGSARRITEVFFGASKEMVEKGGFDIVGHIDKIYMNGSKYPGFDREADWFQKPFLELLDLIAEKGLIVEINCKNWLGRNQMFPHISSLPEIKKRKIPVMVNSDCHFPELVNDGRVETLALLKDAGFRVTRELVDGRWGEVVISE